MGRSSNPRKTKRRGTFASRYEFPFPFFNFTEKNVDIGGILNLRRLGWFKMHDVFRYGLPGHYWEGLYVK